MSIKHPTEEEAKDKIRRRNQQIRTLTEERDRYKAALEKILNIRIQDKQLSDAWIEAREIAFDAFGS